MIAVIDPPTVRRVTAAMWPVRVWLALLVLLSLSILPLQAADLLPGGDGNLEAALARFLGVERTQLECSGTAALVTNAAAVAYWLAHHR